MLLHLALLATLAGDGNAQVIRGIRDDQPYYARITYDRAAWVAGNPELGRVLPPDSPDALHAQWSAEHGATKLELTLQTPDLPDVSAHFAAVAGTLGWVKQPGGDWKTKHGTVSFTRLDAAHYALAATVVLDVDAAKKLFTRSPFEELLGAMPANARLMKAAWDVTHQGPEKRTTVQSIDVELAQPDDAASAKWLARVRAPATKTITGKSVHVDLRETTN